MSNSSILKPQFMYATLTLITYSILTFVIQTQNSLLYIGKLSSAVIPTVVISEVFKYMMIKKLYQIGSANVKAATTAQRMTVMALLEECATVLLLLVSSIFLFAFISIVLGAPPLSHYEETLSLAVLLTTLSVLPFLLLIGTSMTIRMNFVNVLEFGSLGFYIEFLQNAAVGAILGAWVGSVVMPLDWDRSWQAYPIPNIVAALSGNLAGCFFSIIKTVVLNAKKELKKKVLL